MSTSSAASAPSPRRVDPATPGPLAIEAGRDAIEAARRALDPLLIRFDAAADALRVLLGVTGRVVVTGLGKSGLVGAKLAATLSSTGTPAQFVHAGDALHGDVGCLCAGDAIFALSNSGETYEVCRFAEIGVGRGLPVIALTGCGGSSRLARLATVHVDAHVDHEGDPHDLVPSASTTAALVMGDALAIATMVARGYGPAEFHSHHPSGSLGERLDSSRRTG
jgi:arabinose-5-phosphate isomerase